MVKAVETTFMRVYPGHNVSITLIASYSPIYPPHKISITNIFSLMQ